MTQNAKRLLKSLWMRACRFEGIPVDTKFVVFGADNKCAVRYNKIKCITLGSVSAQS